MTLLELEIVTSNYFQMGVHTEIGAAIGKYVACPITVKCPPPQSYSLCNPVINMFGIYELYDTRAK